MASNTTICAKSAFFNSAKLNNLVLKTNENSNLGTIPLLELVNTNSTTGIDRSPAVLNLKFDSSIENTTDNDVIGIINFVGKNSTGNDILYSSVVGAIGTKTASGENGRLAFDVYNSEVGFRTTVLEISENTTTNLPKATVHFELELKSDAGVEMITQETDKSTQVTFPFGTQCGKITMHNAELGSGNSVSFDLLNAHINADSIVIVNHSSAGTSGSYQVNASNIRDPVGVIPGKCAINVKNISGGPLSEAIVLTFAIISLNFEVP